MNTSESINELATALAKAQGQMRGAVKGSTNPHFRSSYSDLASVIDAIREPLSENGLSILQGLGQVIEGQLMMTTRLLHSSGQWVETHSSIPVGQKVNSQTVGSASTYLRRYSIQALVCLPSVDDDGNAASAPESASQPAQATQQALTGSQVATLKKLLGELPGEVTTNFLRALNADNVESVPAARYDWACTALRKKIADASPDV